MKAFRQMIRMRPGLRLDSRQSPGDVCTLVGDLGVGKTVLTQGAPAEGLASQSR